MNIRNIVLNRLEQAVAEHSPMTFPEEMDDDIELDMFGLDSLAFMGLLTSIEKDIGYIPRAILEVGNPCSLRQAQLPSLLWPAAPFTWPGPGQRDRGIQELALGDNTSACQ